MARVEELTGENRELLGGREEAPGGPSGENQELLQGREEAPGGPSGTGSTAPIPGGSLAATQDDEPYIREEVSFSPLSSGSASMSAAAF